MGADSGRRSGDEGEIVDVAVGPALAGLERADDRVLARGRMGARVLAGRCVAAADVAAAPADAQVDPTPAGPQAVLATFHRLWNVDSDLVEMGAVRHRL